jgi:hypothetical protein
VLGAVPHEGACTGGDRVSLLGFLVTGHSTRGRIGAPQTVDVVSGLGVTL